MTRDSDSGGDQWASQGAGGHHDTNCPLISWSDGVDGGGRVTGRACEGEPVVRCLGGTWCNAVRWVDY